MIRRGKLCERTALRLSVLLGAILVSIILFSGNGFALSALRLMYRQEISQCVFTENDREFDFDYHSLLPPTKFDERRLPSLPYISGDTLRAFADHIVDVDMAENSLTKRKAPILSFNPAAVQPGHIIFVKTDLVSSFFFQYYGRIAHPYVLITHNSALPSGKENERKYLHDPKLLAWFGQNVLDGHPKLHPIPLGVANGYWNHGNITVLRSVSRQLKPFHQRTTLLYVNFNVETNANRNATLHYLMNRFGNDADIHFARNRIDWHEYMLQLGDAKFVVSPPGRGTDCHRTWEALIMGAVPIVLQSALSELYDDMSVMVVSDWRQVTRDTLMQYQQKQLKLNDDGVPVRPKVWARHWLQQLQDIRSRYNSIQFNSTDTLSRKLRRATAQETPKRLSQIIAANSR